MRAKLRDAVAGNCVFGVHPENTVLVTMGCHGFAVLFQLSASRTKVIERQAGSNEAKLHQPAGRVVDERQQRAGIAAGLKPGVLRTIDLHQITQALPTLAWLMRRGLPVAAINPRSIRNLPPGQRFHTKTQAMLLGQFLRGQRGTEIRVMFRQASKVAS